MAQLPLTEGIPRFKENEERIDIMTNGSETQSWFTEDGSEVPTVRGLFKEIREGNAYAFEEIKEIYAEALLFKDEAAVRADANLTYTPGSPYTAVIGSIVTGRSDGAVWEIVGAGAANYDLATAGGVRLRRIGDSGEIGTVVLYGSSTLAGNGVTGWTAEANTPSAQNGWANYPNSFGAYLAAKIGNRGRVINRSVGGRNMQGLLDGFATQVAPYKPKFVVGGTGWSNEPGETIEEKASSYISKVAVLRGLCNSIGAKLIIASFNPINNTSTAWRNGQFDVRRALSGMGVRVWDLSGGTAEDDYTFLSGLNADAIHANDAGHLLYAEQIQMADFYSVDPARGNLRGNVNDRAIKQASTETAANCLVATLDVEDRPRSWSILFGARNDSADGSTGILMTAQVGPQKLYVRKITGSNDLQLVLGTTVLFTAPDAAAQVTTSLPHQHLICYRAGDDRLTWFFDGVRVAQGTAGLSSDSKIARVAVGGGLDSGNPATGYIFDDFRVWGTNFRNDGKSTRIFAGEMPTENLLVDADLTQQWGNGVNNAAGTRVPITKAFGTYVPRWSGSGANGSWAINPITREITCTHKINRGSTVAFGAGTFEDPYRSDTGQWSFPVRFTQPPRIHLEARYISDAGGDTLNYALLPIYRGITEEGITGVQVFRTNASNNTAEVEVFMTATGIY